MKTISLLKNQQGVVIIVVLVMLLVMTGVGVTLMSGATLQERMAGNNRQLSIARLNAEAALRQAEQEIVSMNILTTANTLPHDVIAANFNPTGDGRFVDYDGAITSTLSSVFINGDPLTDDLSESTSWTSSNSVAANIVSTSSTRPRYTIEYIGISTFGIRAGEEVNQNDDKKGKNTKFPHMFRITAIGFGANDDIYAVLQSIYSTGR